MRKRDPNRIEMGRRFREARERLNWSREVLAERADLSVSFIADLELGNTGTRLENFIRLCRLLDLNADYVLFGAPGDAVQRIMDLLRELKEKLGLTYVFITHDLTSITYLCDRVVFIDAGTIVEQVDDIRRIAMIRNDYARNLLGSVMGIGVEHGSGAARTGQDRYAAIA